MAGTNWVTHWFMLSLQAAVRHCGMPTEQSRAAPEQTPPWHTSPFEQNRPSSQGVPFASGTFTQPIASVHDPPLQASATYVQSRGPPPRHVPPWHVSPTAHPMPSSHGAFSGGADPSVIVFHR